MSTAASRYPNRFAPGQRGVKTGQIAVLPGVPAFSLLLQLLLDVVQQHLRLAQIGRYQGDFDQRAELEQVLLHQVLATFAAAGQQRQEEQAG